MTHRHEFFLNYIFLFNTHQIYMLLLCVSLLLRPYQANWQSLLPASLFLTGSLPCSQTPCVVLPHTHFPSYSINLAFGIIGDPTPVSANVTSVSLPFATTFCAIAEPFNSTPCPLKVHKSHHTKKFYISCSYFP